MDKRVGPIIAITAGLVICLILLDKSRNATAALVKAKADAAEAKRIDEADDQMRDALEAEQNAVIAAKTAKIAELLANAGKPTAAEIAKDAEIAALKKKMAEFEAAGDTAGALAQAHLTISGLEFLLTTAEERNKGDLFRLNGEWQGKFNALQAIADARFVTIVTKDNRIAKLEIAFGESERIRKAGKFWIAIGKYAPPVTFVVGIILGK